MTHAEDKFGDTVHIGDTVELVYGGDRHEGIVEQIGGPDEGPQLVHVTVTVIVPEGSVRLVKAAPKKAAPSKTGDAGKGEK